MKSPRFSRRLVYNFLIHMDKNRDGDIGNIFVPALFRKSNPPSPFAMLHRAFRRLTAPGAHPILPILPMTRCFTARLGGSPLVRNTVPVAFPSLLSGSARRRCPPCRGSASHPPAEQYTGARGIALPLLVIRAPVQRAAVRRNSLRRNAKPEYPVSGLRPHRRAIFCRLSVRRPSLTGSRAPLESPPRPDRPRRGRRSRRGGAPRGRV